MEYMTTAEAAKLLGISVQRIRQLAAAGTITGQRMGGQWLLDRDSVHALACKPVRKGGRPRIGAGAADRPFTLMNRTHAVCDIVYHSKRKEFIQVGEILDSHRLPIGLFGSDRRTRVHAFNAWWKGRGIPGDRRGLQKLLDDAGAEVPEELLMRNLGLSLSDQYWIRPVGSQLQWESINFFDNDFLELDERAIRPPLDDISQAHPDNTSDGNLAKHWVLRGRKRVLLKEGAKLNQEPFNELVATRLHQRLIQEGEYVPYWIEGVGAEAVSACACFLTDEEEYVPAWYVDRILPERDSRDAYRHYVACCELLGIEGIERALSKMIVCDDILANDDRHYRNFGIIRNVETLACRPAPLFDSGSSLWVNSTLSDLRSGEFSYRSRPFDPRPARQMMLVEDLSWLDTGGLDGFVDEAMAILGQNPLLKDRMAFIRQALQRRVERMIDIRAWW